MGVKLTELIDAEEINMDFLSGKILAVDAFNMLYQFITTIRQPDGSPLSDKDGNPTSHLVGLFYRLTNLVKADIRLAFVFDGKSHILKFAEQKRRSEIKAEAEKQYKEAMEKEDIESMKKYASRTSKLTKEIIEESKEIISAMGLPVIQAPSEGEAQCARMVSRGDAYAVMSQDGDSLLFGSTRIVKNLSISQRKKKKDKLSYDKTHPQLITLKKVLDTLDITKEELIILGILIGTDFNPGGIKGIGPKKALKTIKEYKGNWENMFNDLKWEEHFDHNWKEVYEIFSECNVTEEYKMDFTGFDKEKVMDILVTKHNFSSERIGSICDEIISSQNKSQKGLGDFF